nr:hypothetical protein MmNV_82 [Menippe mercenaria nudivirus]
MHYTILTLTTLILTNVVFCKGGFHVIESVYDSVPYIQNLLKDCQVSIDARDVTQISDAILTSLFIMALYAIEFRIKKYTTINRRMKSTPLRNPFPNMPISDTSSYNSDTTITDPDDSEDDDNDED